MSFMISRETENVGSMTEVESAFQAITSGGDKPFVTEEELLQALPREQALYCMRRMKVYVAPNGRPVSRAYDYKQFAQTLFTH
jgi:hypothetical protein